MLSVVAKGDTQKNEEVNNQLVESRPAVDRRHEQLVQSDGDQRTVNEVRVVQPGDFVDDDEQQAGVSHSEEQVVQGQGLPAEAADFDQDQAPDYVEVGDALQNHDEGQGKVKPMVLREELQTFCHSF